jgi:hypothetical protein
MLAAKPMENEVGAQVLHCHGAPGWMDVKKTQELAKGASFSLCEVLGKKKLCCLHHLYFFRSFRCKKSQIASRNCGGLQ